MFGAKVVRPEAVIKLVESIPTVDAGSFDDGKVGQNYTQKQHSLVQKLLNMRLVDFLLDYH